MISDAHHVIVVFSRIIKTISENIYCRKKREQWHFIVLLCTKISLNMIFAFCLSAHLCEENQFPATLADSLYGFMISVLLRLLRGPFLTNELFMAIIVLQHISRI